MSLWTNRNWSPMLLKEIEKPFNSKDYLFEIKFDGTRAVIYANKDQVIIKNRHQKDITNLYPELQEIKKIVDRNTIFDGEIVSFQNGLPSFQRLQERSHQKDRKKIAYQAVHNPVIFVCFDLLYHQKDLMNNPLRERKEKLKKFQENDVFIKAKYIDEYGKELFEEIRKNKLEGIVAKKKDSVYEIDQRSENWIKIKNWKQESFWIIGYIEKEKNTTISLVLAEKKNQAYKYVGKVTMAKKNKLYMKIKNQNIIPNFVSENISQANFIEPKYKCKIEYMERTKKGHLRQPIFLE